jgi:indolepyruvate ferredoxin oxidoreductase
VARLFTSASFAARLKENFEGEYRLAYNLAPPLLAPRDKRTGRPKKRRFGAWMGQSFTLLAKLRPLRGTPLDIFGYGVHRRMERQLIRDYETLVDTVANGLKQTNLRQAEALLRAHDKVRGYDVVKEVSVARVRDLLQTLMKEFHT